MTPDRERAAARIREAEEARDTLAAALGRAGLQLPSLRVDIAAYADAVPRPLVELGRCSPHLARAMAAAIERGAGR
ncbi:hypothetical protein [Streptomyces beihaiensis]|uniref:Uncharacterized protein n=1 Tax=Streptomyces beihaiensis TaxID=2984495 RepID=A0ABT3TUU4_9ACTN|nr:hypothetical protein [Streptomyces beihaiensis]MCX3060800.1 hypothetical protein [Streptomyces beihaiensis]